jgi:uncharacterized protein YegL
MEKKEIKKNNITELVFILDRSGSMGGFEDDTIGGFNSLIEKQKKVEGKALVTTVLFDNNLRTLHDRIDLQEIEPLTTEDYYVGGCTALLDAVGETVTHIEKVHKYIRPEDVPASTMVVITTDGMENASHLWRADKVKKLVEKKKGEGWEFLFLGADIDAVHEAARFGIGADRSVTYKKDSVGMAMSFDVLDESVACLRSGSAIPKAWKKKLEDDYNKRG